MEHNVLEEEALECVDTYFKDCRLVDIVDKPKLTKIKNSRFMKINGSSSHGDIPCSKTTNVVMQKGNVCRGCQMKARYLMVMFNVNSKTYALAYVGFDDKQKLVPLTKDHITPKMLGGTDSLSNLEPMCYTCNQLKAHKQITRVKNGRETITIPVEEYDNLIIKQKQFAATRDNIRKSINSAPWWAKVLGIHRYIGRKIKKPLENMGYCRTSDDTT